MPATNFSQLQQILVQSTLHCVQLWLQGACSWEWWPPDPPEEWALSGAAWDPPHTADQVTNLDYRN